MGRKTTTRGVEAKGDRIQFTFVYQKQRLRPTLLIYPSAKNLEKAANRLAQIKARIANGTFSLADEFPQYRFLKRLTPTVTEDKPTFNKIADLYLKSIGDLEFATRESYRKILAHFWRPKIGEKSIADIRYSDLASIVGSHPWGSTKTRNNVISVARRVFDMAYADELIVNNPAERLKSLRVQREPPRPYSVDDAELLIAGILKDWGEHEANYVEFGFFTGCRPSEIIALQWSNVDLIHGRVRIQEARVMAHDKNKTKTAKVREIELCPRAFAVIKRQSVLSRLKGGHVFVRETGEPYNDLQLQWRHWRYTHKRLGMSYREPYHMRHTSVSWNLMIGRNAFLVAEEHGHNFAVMSLVYAKWSRGQASNASEVAKIKMAMGFATTAPLEKSAST